jgi:hypothetical protein
MGSAASGVPLELEAIAPAKPSPTAVNATVLVATPPIVVVVAAVPDACCCALADVPTSATEKSVPKINLFMKTPCLKMYIIENEYTPLKLQYQQTKFARLKD